MQKRNNNLLIRQRNKKVIDNIISKKIVIPIEIKVREFLPKAYLAYKIVKNSSFDVVLGGQRNYTNKLIYKNCILLDKNTKPSDREVFSFHRNNFIVMLDEEGPISFQHNTICKERYNLKKLKKQIDSFLFCGRKDLSKINFSSIKSRSFITGNPKFDFLKSNLDIIFKRENNYIKKKYKSFIFITGHYPSQSIRVSDSWIANISKSNVEVQKNLKSHISKKIKFKENRRKNYYALLNLVKKIAEDNPKKIIIFRRHPFESENFINQFFIDKPKNLKLIYKFSVTPWIYNCDLHLHSGCLSSLETIFLKKKLVTFMPFNSIEYFENYKNFKPFFENEYECRNFLKKKRFVKKQFFYKDMKRVLANFSNKKTYKLMLKVFNEKYKNIKSQIIHKKINKNPKLSLLNRVLKIGSFTKSLINKSTIAREYLAKISPHLADTKEIKSLKFKSISLDEMKKTIKLFTKADNFKGLIEVKKISESTFYIKKK
mgnify:CR=1 FL=1